ncbi:NlpC/P60 family protein [Nocardia sp. bgisy134]|uniref:NlpC/P60 family protein n=1 Tax=unclassified Nocardia TaxID=2637762 RepID=UPI003D75C361
MNRKPLCRTVVGFVVATFATLLLAGPAWSDDRNFVGSSGSASGSGTGSASGSVALGVPSPRGLAALAIAMTQTGKPYEWGGTGPNSWDCSGLVQWAFRMVGVNMPRTTWQQATAGAPVPVSQMAPGDVVVLNKDGSHVGIYAGFGNVFNAYGRGVPVGLSPIRQFAIYAVRRF